MTESIIGAIILTCICFAGVVMTFSDIVIVKSVGYLLSLFMALILGVALSDRKVLKSSLVVQEVIFECPECHSISSSKNDFCSKCGAKFDIWEIEK